MPLKDRMETIIVEMVEKGICLDLAQRDFERKYLKIALDINQGSRQATARALGIHRNTLINKLAKHRLRSRKNAS
jgi:DNA-binding NtrC family response regulator